MKTKSAIARVLLIVVLVPSLLLGNSAWAGRHSSFPDGYHWLTDTMWYDSGCGGGTRRTWTSDDAYFCSSGNAWIDTGGNNVSDCYSITVNGGLNVGIYANPGNGTLNMGGSAQINVNGGSTLHIYGVNLTSHVPNPVHLEGGGTLVLEGVNNTFNSGLAVNNGTVRYNRNDQVPDGDYLTVNGSGTLNMNGYSDTVTTFNLAGGVMSASSGTLTAGTYNLSGGTMGGVLGAGNMNVTGNTAFNGTAGATSVNISAGTLTLGSSSRLTGNPAVNVTGGTLAMNGYNNTVGTVTMSSGSITGGGTLTGSSFAFSGGSATASLAGTGAALTSSGSVTLSGVNTYTGGTTVSGGTLSLSAGSDSGTASGAVNSGTITVNSGGTLYPNATACLPNVTGSAPPVSLNVNGGTVTGANGIYYYVNNISMTGGTISPGTLNGSFSIGLCLGGGVTTSAGTGATISGSGLQLWNLSSSDNHTFNIASSGDLLVSGPIGQHNGTESLTKTGSGTLTLSGANTYSGATTVSAGTLSISGSINHSTAVNVNGGTLSTTGADMLADSAAVTVAGGTLTLGGNDTVGSFTMGSGSVGGSATLTAATYALNGGTVNANLGAGPVTVSTGTVTLNGTAAGSTVNIASGTLILGAANRLSSNCAVTAGGTLNLGGFSTTLGSLAGGGTVTAASGTPMLTVGQDNAPTTFSGILQNGGGTLSLTKVGTGALTLSAASTYTGTTTISAGTVNLNSIINGSPTVSVNGGTLQFGSTLANRLKDSGTLDVAGGTVAIGGNIELVGSVTLSSGSITGTTGRLISGSFAVQSGTVSARLSGGDLTKTSGGTVMLSGANDYSGSTTLGGGTLALSGNGSIDYSAGLSLAAGATFDVSALPSPYTLNVPLSASGTGTAPGSSAAAIQGASGGVVDFGTQPIVLTYDGTHPALYISQGSLQLEGNDWTVNVSGSPLANGTYTLVQQAGGAINNLGSHTVSGTAIGPGVTASIAVQGAQVNLVIGTPTTTTLARAAGANPSTYGDSLTLRATVSPAPPNGETITFMDGATVLGTGLTSGGVATLSTNNLAAAAHTLSASYAGDGTYLGSSGTLAQTVKPRPVALSGARPYDGTTNASFTTLSVGNKLGSDVVNVASGIGGLAGVNVGAHALTATNNLALGGAQATNYTMWGASGLVTISQTNLTVTAAANTKTYDGNTTAAATPTITSGSLQASDTASFTETYDNRNAGTGKTLTPAGSVSDGNGGANYHITFASATSGVVNAQPITVTAVPDTKAYDGGTSSTGVPTVSPAVVAGDTANFTQSFDTKDVGTGKTLTPAGSVTDGNSGGNYSVTLANSTSGQITAKPLAVAGIEAGDKVYDGTTNAILVVSNAVLVGVVGSEDVQLSTTNALGGFTNRNVGVGQLVQVNGLELYGADIANYSLSQPVTNASITQLAITVTAVTDTKMYDGTNASTAVPMISPGVASGDTANFSQTYDTRHVGTGKTLTPAGSVSDGNGGANYAVTLANDTIGVITNKPITVTAVTDTKLYDGTPSSSGVPSISPGLAAGDTASFAQTFDTKDVGTGKTLTPAGSVTDGNSGGDYAVTFANNTSGQITMKPLAVTGIEASDRVYDGTTNATLVVSNAGLVGVVGSEDVQLSTTNALGGFTNRNVGVGQLVQVSGLELYGADIANYALSQPATNASITPLAITVTAVTETKPYDATTTSTGVPAVSPGVATGDTANFSQAFDTRHAGSGKTLTPTGSVSDGNGGANYTVTLVNDTTGVINPKPITVTAVTDTKVYDGITSSAGAPLVSPPVAAGDTANFSQTFDTKDVGTGKTLAPAGSVTDGNGGADYTVTFANDTTGVITGAASATLLSSSQNPSVVSNSVTFTATVTSAAGTPTGDVVFKTNGTILATVALSGLGVASAATADLAVGTNAVTAEYAAQANWLASSDSLQQINGEVIYSQTNAILSIVDAGGGQFAIQLLGTPGAEYYLVASADLGTPMSGWVPVAGTTNAAPIPAGQWLITVSNPAPSFYRLQAVHPAP